MVRAFIYTEQSIKLAVLYATLYINVSAVVPKQSFYKFLSAEREIRTEKKRCEKLFCEKHIGYTCNFLTLKVGIICGNQKVGAMNLWVYVSAVCLWGSELLAFVEGKNIMRKTQCEPRHEKTCFRGFRLGKNRTGYSTTELASTIIHRRRSDCA